jgi:hypothetical protein
VSEDKPKRRTNGQFGEGNGYAKGHGSCKEGSLQFQKRAKLAIAFVEAVWQNNHKALPSGFKNTPELMLKAAMFHIEQAYGKAKQQTEVSGPDGENLNIVVRFGHRDEEVHEVPDREADRGVP